jgi:hypothetical protein
MKEFQMNNFPWFLDEADQFAMTVLCKNELAQWRASVSYHKGLLTNNEKLANRRNLEQCFDVLKMAWAQVSNESAAMAA